MSIWVAATPGPAAELVATISDGEGSNEVGVPGASERIRGIPVLANGNIESFELQGLAARVRVAAWGHRRAGGYPVQFTAVLRADTTRYSSRWPVCSIDLLA